jgi:glycosyltransferase involved in cell wall biosynthesis
VQNRASDPDDSSVADPELAVIVISHGPRASLHRAVASILNQKPTVELVVVHTGPGDPRSVGVPPDVRVVREASSSFAGRARNIGVAATQAPYVAFLADDCEAAPGWVEGRLAAHRAGAAAVASALLPHRMDRAVALASHISLYVRRLPGADPSLALRYGVSYARSLLERHGRFREDVPSGEDTEYNVRLIDDEAPVWAPQVVTHHYAEERLCRFLADQYARGARMVRAWTDLHPGARNPVAVDALRRAPITLTRARRWLPVEGRASLLGAAPLVLIGAVAYAWGARRGART